MSSSGSSGKRSLSGNWGKASGAKHDNTSLPLEKTNSPAGVMMRQKSQTHLQKSRRLSSKGCLNIEEGERESEMTLTGVVNRALNSQVVDKRKAFSTLALRSVTMPGLYKHITRSSSYLKMVEKQIRNKIPENVFNKNIQGMSLMMRLNNYRAMDAKMKHEKRPSLTKRLSNVSLREEFDYKTSDLARMLEKTRSGIKNQRNKDIVFPQDRMARITFLRKNVLQIEKRFGNLSKGNATTSSPNTNAQGSDNTSGEQHTSRFTNGGQALKYFQKYGRIVLILIQWVDLIAESQRNSLEEELRSFVDIAADLEGESGAGSYMDEDGLVFDKNVFKAKKEITLSADMRKTLTTRFEYRTPEMIAQVLHGVRALASLSEYPLQTQERLCQVAWYTSVPPKRVILRQGHLPECFYFILSGMAYVKKVTPSDSTGESSMNIAARLTKGQSFGLYEYDDNGNVEVGLVFNTQRTATVESATDMELLTIAREDFYKIFMNADNPEEEAEHIKFLRQIPVMKNWPVDEIKNEPGSCLLHYFKRGSLITENIKSSDWLYVVKQGAVEVIKKLRAVKPHSSRAHRPQSHPLCDVVYPYLGLADAAPRVNTGRKRPETSYVNREVYESMERYYDKLRDEARKDVDSRESIKLPRIKIDVATNENVDRCHERRIGGYEKEADSVKTPPIVNFTIPGLKSEIVPGKPGSSHSTFKPSTAKCSKDHFLLPTSSDLRKSFTSSSECYFKNPETCRNPEYVFIKIERLGVKGIVGLNWLEFKEDGDIYEKSPTACLVSQGAEVLMLSKKLFVKHANDKVKIKLRDIVRPYPKDEKLQENLQIQTDWDCYKNNMLSSLSMRRSLTTVG